MEITFDHLDLKAYSGEKAKEIRDLGGAYFFDPEHMEEPVGVEPMPESHKKLLAPHIKEYAPGALMDVLEDYEHLQDGSVFTSDFFYEFTKKYFPKTEALTKDEGNLWQRTYGSYPPQYLAQVLIDMTEGIRFVPLGFQDFDITGSQMDIKIDVFTAMRSLDFRVARIKLFIEDEYIHVDSGVSVLIDDHFSEKTVFYKEENELDQFLAKAPNILNPYEPKEENLDF